MRPLALHAAGFGVFRDAIDIDFEGVDYFALVGPTGAGKSTVIDALCFALYGSVPRYGDERLTARVVTIGKQEAKVSLTFAVGEGVYRATRVVRVRGDKATTPEALLERVLADGTSEVLAGSARDDEAGSRTSARASVRAFHEVRRPAARRVRALPARRSGETPRSVDPAARPTGLRPDRSAGPATRRRRRSKRSRSTNASSRPSPTRPKPHGRRPLAAERSSWSSIASWTTRDPSTSGWAA